MNKEAFERFFYQKYKNTQCENWLNACFTEQKAGYQRLMRIYNADHAEAEWILDAVCRAVDQCCLCGIFIEPDTFSGAAALGIRLFYENQQEHPASRYFADTGEVCMITMANLSGICKADTDKKSYLLLKILWYSPL